MKSTGTGFDFEQGSVRPLTTARSLAIYWAVTTDSTEIPPRHKNYCWRPQDFQAVITDITYRDRRGIFIYLGYVIWGLHDAKC